MAPITYDDLRDVLTTVRRIFPAAVIAGGACRDILLGRPVKDIDVWIPMTLADAAIIFDLVLEFFPRPGETYGTMTWKDGRRRGILGVHKVKVLDFDVDLIFVDPEQYDRGWWPSALVATFDFGLCQIWMEHLDAGDLPSFHTTVAFHRDVDDRAITVTNPDAFRACRVARLQEKYPWPLRHALTHPHLGENT